ncbi:MAG: glycosyltransferase, partial [Chloroflexota bacterium]|nr:glycosyltransferase [Chloroflexota bacterium]
MRDVAPVDVTVVVATRNRATLLPACIAALSRQKTDAHFELVVVDNGSQDATAEIARAWAQRDPRVRLVQEAAVGVSGAKNAGIRSARGDLVLFTDDDVVLPDGWIAAFVDFFRTPRATPVLAGGPVLPIAQDLSPWPAWITASGTAELPRLYHGDKPRRLGEYDWLWGANMAAPRRVFDAIGAFDETIGVSGDRRGTFEDVELVQRVAAHGGESWYLPAAVLYHPTPTEAARPQTLAGKAFNRGANDVLRDRRGSVYERSLPVPRAQLAGALAAPPLLAAWMLAAVAFRATGHPSAFELARRCAWGAGWC